VAWVATATDLYWALDDAQQKLLLRLTPRSFDDDTVAWGLALAGTYSLVGDRARALAYADSARTTAETLVRVAPDNALLHAYLGLAYAYQGRAPDAIREGRAAVGRLPLAKDAFEGPYTQHQLARIYILIGKYDDALDQLEPLLKIPYWLSPAWLRLDPTFAPLRNNARFKRLVAGAA
jgi:tetratricopeptide (TPR) repeat protein